jgi:hypothetical protein
MILFLTAIALFGKDRAWQTGKLAGIDHSARSQTATGLFTHNAATKIETWTVTIDAGDRKYVAEAERVTGELGGHGFNDY